MVHGGLSADRAFRLEWSSLAACFVCLCVSAGFVSGDVEDPSLFEGEELPESDEDEDDSDEDESEEAGAGVGDAALFHGLEEDDLPSDSDEDDPDYKP